MKVTALMDEPPPDPRRPGPRRRNRSRPGARAKAVIAAVITLGIMAVIFCTVRAEKQAEEDAINAVRTRVETFRSDIEKVVKNDAATEAEIRAAIDRIDHEPEHWKGYSTESAVAYFRSTLTGTILCYKPRRDFTERFDGAMKTLDAMDSVSSDDLIKTRWTLVELRADGHASETQISKMNSAIVKIDHVLVSKMRTEAKTLAADSSTTPRQGLAKYATAEDYVRRAVEDAKRANDKAELAEYTAIFKDLIQDSNEYATKVITPEFIESIPWKDLLNGEMATKWSTVQNVHGFSRRVEKGILWLSPPDAGSQLQGVAGILDQPNDNLRHFVLEMDFAIEGRATMYFHVAPPPGSPSDLQSETLGLLSGDRGFTSGVQQTLVATYVGSRLAVSFHGDVMVTDCRDDAPWYKRRRGGILFEIPAGTYLTVTRMRIKDLR